MHAEQTQIVAGSLTGNDQVLFGNGWCRLLNDSRNLIKAIVLSNRGTADCTEKNDFIFTSRLNGGNSTFVT